MEILERKDLPQTLASFHLRVLRDAGVVTAERRGPFIYYRLADASLFNLLEACARYARRSRSPGRPPSSGHPGMPCAA